MSDDFILDWDRESRTAAAEAILCDSKSADLIAAMLLAAEGRRILLTRLDAEKRAALPAALAATLDYDPLSRTAIAGGARDLSPARLCIVAAGTSDLPVAREVARTLAFHGRDSTVIADVGVAGLWRLMQRIDDIRRHDLIVAVAGMEGALFSVLAGLVSAPVIAVPTSVGYGVAQGGRAALTGALASCAPGLLTVNIDNGYGAACAALRIAALLDRRGQAADLTS